MIVEAHPVGEYLLITIDKKEKISDGGIILAAPIKEDTKIATIVEVGPKVENKDLKPGVKVIIHDTAGLGTKFKDYYFTKETAIYGYLEFVKEEGEVKC